MKIFRFIILFIVLSLLSVRPISAGTLKFSLSKLPEYKNTGTFRIYYTYFETENKQATVNLYIQKDGKDWRQANEKNKTNVSGYFEVGGGDFYDGEGKYNFYAKAVTVDETITSPTVSTILDRSAPSAPTEYSKERVNPTTYKLSWKNPYDEDFSKVYIYRSKETSFIAESSTRIAEVGGSKDERMTFNDGSAEANVEYYYALRAIDRAGNASGVVTDAPGTVIAGQVAGASTVASNGSLNESEVKLLPQKESTAEAEDKDKISEGGELGGGISDESGAVEGTAIEAITKRPILMVGIVAVILVGLAFFLINRRKN